MKEDPLFRVGSLAIYVIVLLLMVCAGCNAPVPPSAGPTVGPTEVSSPSLSAAPSPSQAGIVEGIPGTPLAAGEYSTAGTSPQVAFAIESVDAGFWRGAGETATGFALQSASGALGVVSLQASGLTADAVVEAFQSGLTLEPDQLRATTVAGSQAISLNSPARSTALTVSVAGLPFSFRAGEQNQLIVVDDPHGPVLILLGAMQTVFETIQPPFERFVSSLSFE